jgi:hypothetical protein
MTRKRTAPKDNQTNQQNANIGTDGTNTAYDKGQGNRGKQLDPTPNNANNGGKDAK